MARSPSEIGSVASSRLDSGGTSCTSGLDCDSAFGGSGAAVVMKINLLLRVVTTKPGPCNSDAHRLKSISAVLVLFFRRGERGGSSPPGQKRSGSVRIRTLIDSSAD